jgi:hypothetical protein
MARRFAGLPALVEVVGENNNGSDSTNDSDGG